MKIKELSTSSHLIAHYFPLFKKACANIRRKRGFPPRSPGSKACRMAHQEVSGIAAVHSPAGTFATAPASRGVKPEAADDHEDVSIFGINGNPVPGAFLPVIQEKPGMAGGREQTGFLQHKGSAAGTVIMSIIMPPVPPAQPVRLVDQGIGCCNGALDLRRGISGGEWLSRCAARPSCRAQSGRREDAQELQLVAGRNRKREKGRPKGHQPRREFCGPQMS